MTRNQKQAACIFLQDGTFRSVRSSGVFRKSFLQKLAVQNYFQASPYLFWFVLRWFKKQRPYCCVYILLFSNLDFLPQVLRGLITHDVSQELETSRMHFFTGRDILEYKGFQKFQKNVFVEVSFLYFGLLSIQHYFFGKAQLVLVLSDMVQNGKAVLKKIIFDPSQTYLDSNSKMC